MPMNNRLLRPRQSIHPEAADWANRVRTNGGSVSGTTLTAVDRFVKSVYTAGIRDRFYRLNLFCGTGLEACLVPLFRSASFGGTTYGNATDTNTNFVIGDYAETGASGGLKGNGTNKSLSTGMAGTVLSAGDRHLAAYEMVNATTDYSTSVGANGAAFANMHALGVWTSTSGYWYRTHNTLAGNASFSKATGFLLGSDTSSTASVLYRNGSSVASATGQPAGGSSSNNYTVFTSTGSEFSEARLGGYSIGLSMSGSQVASYNTAIQAFQASLARNV